MVYALNLDPETYRVLSVTEDQYGAEGQPRVESFPEGDISDYLYVNGEFVYSPLPPEYPLCPRDVEAGKAFSMNGELYRARTAIAKGEPVTPYNSEAVSQEDLLNALEAQKGE